MPVRNVHLRLTEEEHAELSALKRPGESWERFVKRVAEASD